MDQSWWPPEDRPKGPAERVFMPAFFISVGTLLLPQGRFRIVVGFVPLIYLCWEARAKASGDINQDYLSVINFTLLFIKWLDFTVFRVPELSFRRVRLDGSVETVQEIKNLSLWGKFQWSFSMFSTLRGIGWNWEVKNIDHVPKDVSRFKFVARCLVGILYCYAYLDIGTWLLDQFVFYNQDPMPDFFSISWIEQIAFALIVLFFNGFAMALVFYLPAAIAVGTGLYAPQDWPHMFGPYSEAYSMRNIWGHCWHQNLRRTFETINNWIISIFRIRKGTLFSRYFQLYCAFCVSAAIHHLGAMNIKYTPSYTYQIMFFLTQPIAITIEDIAIHFGQKAGLRYNVMTRCLGYLCRNPSA